MFSVAQTRKSKNSKPELMAVPSSWVGDKCVFFSTNEITKLSKDPKSKPGKNWAAKPAKILAEADSYEAAEIRVTELTSQTDSEDASIGTRRKPPAKKVKFSSNVYELSEVNFLYPKIERICYRIFFFRCNPAGSPWLHQATWP